MPIYLELEGIPGDATQEQHRGWMDIETLHFNVSRNMNTQAGSTANREASEPTISEVVLTKVTDSSSTQLFSEACVGRTGKLVHHPPGHHRQPRRHLCGIHPDQHPGRQLLGRHLG